MSNATFGAAEMRPEPIVYLVGPTASGKKRIALALKDRLEAELLALDSMKVFRGMELGTDKASRHRFALTDLVGPSESFSVGEYVRAAKSAVCEIRGRGRFPFFVGGTGLYLRALVRGLFEGPDIPFELRNHVRERLQRWGPQAGHDRLRRIDPCSAIRIHPNDLKRLGRALEVFEATGRPLSVWQREHTVQPISGIPILVGVRWSSEVLRRRIEERVDSMLERGLIEEVRRICAVGAIGSVAAEAIGYREALAVLSGIMNLQECRRKIVLSTWRLARRQHTWFRQFPEIVWLEGEKHSEEKLVSKAFQAIESALRPLRSAQQT